MAAKKVGILVGWEDTFPPAFIDAVNKKGNGEISAEMAQVGNTTHEDEKRYDVLVDRISHEIHMYKPWLKLAALNGTYVINDPFWWLSDDKFFDNALISRLGLAAPRTVVLPSFERNPSTTEKSHRNMLLMDWGKLFDYLKFPMFMKPYDGGGWKHVYKCKTPEEVFYYYSQTGQHVMMLQEAIEFELYCRCLCIGRDNIIPIEYDPTAKERTGFGQYVIGDRFEAGKSALADRIIQEARVINNALGYDMNSVEFAVRKESGEYVPYAIDFMNPAPDMDYYSIQEPYFKRVVAAMSDLVVDIAKNGRELNTGHYPWRKLLAAGGQNGAAKVSKKEKVAK
ncbi:MAG: hypothetical protein FJZ01_03800 [Candidatus Sericytochromatia bacterium]|nr:hypothetical protein [Candidatus Tanganyikabacteria bacterium]